MSGLFSIETVLFTFWEYPVSYLEFVGTLLYLWSVWLIARRHVLTWPVGIVSVLLFMALFYQIHLYSAALEQIYYLGACSLGWWFWSRSKGKGQTITDVRFSPRHVILAWAGVTGVLAFLLGLAMTRLHLWLPGLFPEAAAFPFLDALTTIMSFVAMWLMVTKRIESWIYWIIVDVIGIWLYFVKGVPFLALLYVILLGLAVRGLAGWTKTRRQRNAADPREEAEPLAATGILGG